MLRQSPHRLLVAFICAFCLTIGALPAAALPGIDGESASLFEPGSWLARFWHLVGEPVASLFAADGTQPLQVLSPPSPQEPPTPNGGLCIDPDGVPAAPPCVDQM